MTPYYLILWGFLHLIQLWAKNAQIVQIGHHLLSLQSNYHSTWHPLCSPLSALALHNHSKWSDACLFLLKSKANTLLVNTENKCSRKMASPSVTKWWSFKALGCQVHACDWQELPPILLHTSSNKSRVTNSHLQKE